MGTYECMVQKLDEMQPPDKDAPGSSIGAIAEIVGLPSATWVREVLDATLAGGIKAGDAEMARRYKTVVIGASEKLGALAQKLGCAGPVASEVSPVVSTAGRVVEPQVDSGIATTPTSAFVPRSGPGLLFGTNADQAMFDIVTAMNKQAQKITSGAMRNVTPTFTAVRADGSAGESVASQLATQQGVAASPGSNTPLLIGAAALAALLLLK